MAEPNTAVTARLSCGMVENVICEIWGEYFGHAVSPYDNFFDLGGDSLALIDVVGRLRERGLPVRSSMAMRNPSPCRLAEALTVHTTDTTPVTVPALSAAAHTPVWTVQGAATEPIVPGAGTPLYVVHSDSHVEAERDAAVSWGGTRPVTGLPLPGYRGPALPFGTVGELADRLLPSLAPRADAYRLAGFGVGAVVALELARGLADRGETVATPVLIRPPALGPAVDDDLLQSRLAMLARRFGLGGAEDLDEIHTRVRQDGWYDDGVHPADLPRLQQLWVDLTLAVRAYAPGRYDGPAVLVHDLADPPEVARTWSEAVPGVDPQVFDHGIDSPMAGLRDERLAAVMRRALES